MATGLAGENVTLELEDAGSLGLVRDSGDERWLGVVMPMPMR